eukprot:6490584-Amphidinium_carterae.2
MFSLLAEHLKKLHDQQSPDKLAELRRNTSSSSTGLHTTERVNTPSLPVSDSVLVVGPPRLALMRMRSLTTSTGIDGICMRRGAPTIFSRATTN